MKEKQDELRSTHMGNLSHVKKEIALPPKRILELDRRTKLQELKVPTRYNILSEAQKMYVCVV